MSVSSGFFMRSLFLFLMPFFFFFKYIYAFFKNNFLYSWFSCALAYWHFSEILLLCTLLLLFNGMKKLHKLLFTLNQNGEKDKRRNSFCAKQSFGSMFPFYEPTEYINHWFNTKKTTMDLIYHILLCVWKVYISQTEVHLSASLQRFQKSFVLKCVCISVIKCKACSSSSSFACSDARKTP